MRGAERLPHRGTTGPPASRRKERRDRRGRAGRPTSSRMDSDSATGAERAAQAAPVRRKRERLVGLPSQTHGCGSARTVLWTHR
jgi:hypothetical protein